MPALEITATVCLVQILLVAAWFDVRERRVPNLLSVGGLALGLTFGALEGWTGLGASAAGAGIALAVALPIFLAGGLGGGDVKLMMAVGAFLGPAKLPLALVAIALVGGVLVLVEVVRRKKMARTLTNLRLIVTGMNPQTFTRWKRRGEGEPLTIDAPAAVTVPYAVAIALGVIIARLVQ